VAALLELTTPAGHRMQDDAPMSGWYHPRSQDWQGAMAGIEYTLRPKVPGRQMAKTKGKAGFRPVSLPD